MESSQNDRLPERFDEQVTLEIEDTDDDERPRVRIRDIDEVNAWLSADISVVVSLSEQR